METQLVRRVPHQVRIGLLTGALFVLFLITAYLAHIYVVKALNRQVLAGLTQSMLTRAEIATDYAVIELGDLYEQGHINCEAHSMAAQSRAVFEAGSIKDILTSVNGRICSVAAF